MIAQAIEGFQRHVAARTAHSSFCSSSSAPTRRTMASSLGKMATTSVRRLISPLRRSSGLVEWSWRQWCLGKAMWASTSSSASSIRLASLRKRVAQAVGDGAPFRVGGLRRLLREGGADGGRHHRALRGPTWASALRMKCTRQRCQVERQHLGGGRLQPFVRIGDDELDAAQAPARQRAQELGPERLGLRGPTAMPSTSRRPSPLTPTAIITATDTILPLSRTFT